MLWFAGDRPRTHQIAVLIAEIATYRDEVTSALGDAAALDPYYVTTRYPDAIGGGIPGAAFFEPDARLALERSRRVVAYADAVLPSAPS